MYSALFERGEGAHAGVFCHDFVEDGDGIGKFGVVEEQFDLTEFGVDFDVVLLA